MHTVGVDGSPDGWLAVWYEDESYGGAAQYDDIEELWGDHEHAETILIDVPIGLRQASNEQRQCDAAARKKLSPHRHTSVFPTPVRDAVHCENYETAKAKQEELTDGSLGTQTWAIAGKIATLDCFLRDTTAARGTVREAHPEVCFWALNDGVPMQHSKTGQPLMAFWERVEVLKRIDREVLGDIQAAGGSVQTTASNDDLLDAFALALSASSATGDLQTLPSDPEIDAEGLRMEMVYAVR